jgi:hypothetical protein
MVDRRRSDRERDTGSEGGSERGSEGLQSERIIAVEKDVAIMAAFSLPSVVSNSVCSDRGNRHTHTLG